METELSIKVHWVQNMLVTAHGTGSYMRHTLFGGDAELPVYAFIIQQGDYQVEWYRFVKDEEAARKWIEYELKVRTSNECE